MAIAGLFDSVMDTIRFEFNSSVFSLIKSQAILSWVNPAISQYNKWAVGFIEKKARFFGSTTFLVWVTDLWHFAKAVMLVCVCAALVSYHPLINKALDLLIALCAYTWTFQLSNWAFLSKHK